MFAPTRWHCAISVLAYSDKAIFAEIIRNALAIISEVCLRLAAAMFLAGMSAYTRGTPPCQPRAILHDLPMILFRTVSTGALHSSLVSYLSLLNLRLCMLTSECGVIANDCSVKSAGRRCYAKGTAQGIRPSLGIEHDVARFEPLSGGQLCGVECGSVYSPSACW